MTTRPLVRLLVVEDEPEILAEVAGYLRRRGELVLEMKCRSLQVALM